MIRLSKEDKMKKMKSGEFIGNICPKSMKSNVKSAYSRTSGCNKKQNYEYSSGYGEEDFMVSGKSGPNIRPRGMKNNRKLKTGDLGGYPKKSPKGIRRPLGT